MPSYLQLQCLLFDYALFIFSYLVFCLIMPSYLQLPCLLFDYALFIFSYRVYCLIMPSLSSVTVSTV